MTALLQRFLAWLSPPRRPSRYRVMPRHDPFVFRRQLRRDIHRQLRELGFDTRRVARGTGTT